MSQSLARFQSNRPSFRQATVSLQGLSTIGQQAVASQAQLVGELADTTMAHLAKRAERSRQAAVNTYNAELLPGFKAQNEALRQKYGNSKEYLDAATAYVDGVSGTLGDAKVKSMYLTAARGLVADTYVKESGKEFEALKATEADTLKSEQDLILSEYGSLDVASEEGLVMQKELLARLQENVQTQTFNEIQDIGAAPGSKLEKAIISRQKTKFQELARDMQTQLATNVAMRSDNPAGFIIDIMDGKTGVPTFDNMPIEDKLKVLNQGIQVNNVREIEERQQEKKSQKNFNDQFKNAKESIYDPNTKESDALASLEQLRELVNNHDSATADDLEDLSDIEFKYNKIRNRGDFQSQPRARQQLVKLINEGDLAEAQILLNESVSDTISQADYDTFSTRIKNGKEAFLDKGEPFYQQFLVRLEEHLPKQKLNLFQSAMGGFIASEGPITQRAKQRAAILDEMNTYVMDGQLEQDKMTSPEVDAKQLIRKKMDALVQKASDFNEKIKEVGIEKQKTRMFEDLRGDYESFSRKYDYGFYNRTIDRLNQSEREEFDALIGAKR